MGHIQLIKIDENLSKYDQIIEYLKQDNEYWLKNNKWDFTKKIFYGKKIRNSRYLHFSSFRNMKLKNEVKFYFLYKFKNLLLKPKSIYSLGSVLSHFGNFVKAKSLLRLDQDKIKTRWKSYLINQGIKYNEEQENRTYFSFANNLVEFIQAFYDDRKETEKDIWNTKNIKGAKIPASYHTNYLKLNFTSIPEYYRESVKNYLKTLIIKRSCSHCANILRKIDYFISSFYSRGYSDGFIEELNRQDIENYIYHMSNEFDDKNSTYKSKFISYVRKFLEYIQLAQYDKAPKKQVSFLIFQDDIPRRELHSQEVKKAKFIPEPIMKQIDNNIRYLDRPQYIPMYILLRETGWRGTDILNLRYHNCLEKVWDKKKEEYHYYLCGEITKTGIANLKIPIKDKVAEMVEDCIKKAKEKSNEKNNPKKYLFNTYQGKRKNRPMNKQILVHSIRRLIEEKDIRDSDGKLYHFNLHQLRHTRAKEYTEQGLGVSLIQQILGHQSLQMTIHYAKVTENKLYEEWKDTKDLELFKVESEEESIKQIDLDSETGERLIKYEYVKKNLDAVRVPFGMCFKPSKMTCKRQLSHCLNCGSFCTTIDNIPEYEAEIKKVENQIKLSDDCGRNTWKEKHQEYLNLLENMLQRLKKEKIIHKNDKSREVKSNG